MNVLKVILPSLLTFIVGLGITPFLTDIFYKNKMWRKSSRAMSDTSKEFGDIHDTERELNTPRIGGVIIWISVSITVLFFYILSITLGSETAIKLNFLSRNQTIVPLATFLLAALIGLGDDFIQIFGSEKHTRDPMYYRKIKIVSISFIALIVSLWFYFKLDTAIHVPFWHDVELGLWFIPFFIVTTLAVFTSSVIDGLDGLSGGVLASIFTSYAVIAFVQNQIDIAALCAVISGGVLIFLWFNIPPARFYMGETGMLALTVTLSVIAFLTKTVLLLPIIALPLTVTSLSVVAQLVSYKYFNKRRVLIVSPLHHHLEAIGWPKTKIVMRYWIVSVLCAILGLILVLIS